MSRQDHIYLGAVLALSLASYFITLKLFWMFLFLSHLIPLSDMKCAIPGISLGMIVVLIIWGLSYGNVQYIIDIGQRSVLHAIVIGDLKIPLNDLPLYILANPFSADKGGRFLVSASLSIQSLHGILPLVSLSMTDISSIDPINLEYTLCNMIDFPWSQTSPITQEFFNCLWLGHYPYQATWFKIIGHMGLIHLLCLSGYHVSLLETACLRKKAPFLGLSFGFIFLLKGAYPFTRAVFYKVFRMYRIKPSSAFLYSLLVPICAQPWVWTTWSFWLTLYYALLFYGSPPDMRYMKVFSLGWSILFTGKICPPLILIGMVFEEFLIGMIFPICYLGAGLVFWYPRFFNEFFGAIELFCRIVDPLTYYTIDCAAWLTLPLILGPFFTKNKQLKES